MKRLLLTAALLLPLSIAAFGQPQPPGSAPAKNGRASFKLGDAAFDYAKVSGFFMQAGGYTTVSLSFSKDGNPAGDRLAIGLMIQKPGAVDMNQPMGNAIDYRAGGTFYTYQKGKSQCTVTVTKLTPTLVEGTAECAVLNEQGGSRTTALTGLKFSATTALGGAS
jgi:opacity protein-like surface antigen